METAEIVFGDKQVNKKEFYSARDAILLNKVDTGKIIVSNEIIVDNNSKKFIIGYTNDASKASRANVMSEDVIRPLSIQLD